MWFRKKENFNLQEVIDGCLKEKAKSQRLMVEQFYAMARRTCLRYAQSMEEAEEIADDGFVKMFSSLGNFDRSKAFEPWLTTIMVRTAIDYFRRRQNILPVSELDETIHMSEEGSSIDLLSAQEMMSLIQQVLPVYRLVFNLYTIEGYDHNEIAEQLGITASTSRANLAKARSKLQLWVKQLTDYHHQNSGKHVFAAF